MSKKLVHGVGLNDSKYPVRIYHNGKSEICAYYSCWSDMLKRCHSKKYQESRPTYKGCSVCKEWLIFSNFKAWMEKQDWIGMCLDKDFIMKGNKIYCPERCCFIPKWLNNFTTYRQSKDSLLPIGVTNHKKSGKLSADISNPFTRKREHLGLFDDAKDAYEAWLYRKKQIANLIADTLSDERVAGALRRMF